MEQELLEKQELELALEEETKKKNKTKRVKRGKLEELFRFKKKWCKGSYALDKTGNAVGTNSIIADKFCLMGGIFKCYGPEQAQEKVKDLQRAVSSYIKGHPEKYEHTYQCIPGFNDDPKTTIKDVQAVVKLAGI